METKTSWLINIPIAHRGLHNFDFPENSIPAFENAATHGFAIELDLRLTSDNHIIVFHDEKLGRMTDCDGYISNITLDALNDIKLKKTEYTIPTFEKVLETINGKVPLLIEIKKAEKSYTLEEKLIDMLKSYDGDYAVESFDPFSLEYFYNNVPQIMRGQLSSYFHHSDIDASHREKMRLKKLKYNDVSHPDFIAYKITNLPNKYVKNAGLPVIGWTIKNKIQAQQAEKICANYIFEGFIPEVKTNEE